MKRESRLLGWIGWAGLDAIGRLLLMSGSTIIFSRILLPHEFGVSALVLTIVTFAAVFVGAPFEEALTQRRSLRMAHLRAALGASWLVGAMILTISYFLGGMLAGYYGEPEFRFLLPIAMISIFFGGHSDILTALARRLRRFNDVAYATLMGHVIGIALALALAFLGYGLWALIAQRLLVVIARAVLLQWRLKYLVLPSLSFRHLGDVGRFAGVSFLARMTDNLSYLAFNNLVQGLYGMTILGHVNMAMRLIEPIRGAIQATGHNLAFSFFARASGYKARLLALIGSVVSQTAFMTVPVFIGLAAVAPVLVPIVVGSGWDDSIQILICLSLASAVAVPSGLIYTALSADGRPEFNLLSLVVSLVAIISTLLAFSWLGPVSVGLSRIAGDVVRTAMAIVLPMEVVSWPWRARVAILLPAWWMSGVMGAIVVALGLAITDFHLIWQLVMLVGAGIVAYAGLLLLFAKPTVKAIVSQFRKKSLS